MGYMRGIKCIRTERKEKGEAQGVNEKWRENDNVHICVIQIPTSQH
jgi:hypothetical protein